MKFKNVKLVFYLPAIVLITGCTANSPKIQEGPFAERTFDGLVRVENTRMQKVWVKPDINLAGYDKIMLQGVGVQYRAVRFTGSDRLYTENTEFFPLSDQQKARVVETIAKAFKDEMAKCKYYSLTDTPDRKTLTVRGELLDIVSRTPPEVGFREIYLSSFGEATLVIELRDSMSDEIFARVVDRRAAEPFEDMIKANTVSAKMEVSRLATTWARLIRQGLDHLHDVEAKE